MKTTVILPEQIENYVLEFQRIYRMAFRRHLSKEKIILRFLDTKRIMEETKELSQQVQDHFYETAFNQKDNATTIDH